MHGDPCDELLSPGQRVAQDGSVSLELGRGTQHREVADDTQHDGGPGRSALDSRSSLPSREGKALGLFTLTGEQQMLLP